MIWGASLSELKKVRPNAVCHVDHQEDVRRALEKAEGVGERYDLERGLLITVAPVRFSATCVDWFEEGRVYFMLDGNPPVFTRAQLIYERADYSGFRQKLLELYGQADELDAQRLSWWRRILALWPGRSIIVPERLTWRRPMATVTLYSREYERLGRKFETPTLILEGRALETQPAQKPLKGLTEQAGEAVGKASAKRTMFGRAVSAVGRLIREFLGKEESAP